MPARKKPWSKPQLIVLGRGKPEENVLANCKAGGFSGPGYENNCNRRGGCSSIGKS
jgi:hypothetical protein